MPSQVVNRHGLAGDQPGCGFPFGVFKGECWCLDYPILCTADQYKAAVAAVYPGMVYAPISEPTPPPAVGAGTSTLPAPYTVSEAQAAIDQSLAQQTADTQAQVQAAMNQTAQNLADISSPGGPLGLSWLVWAAIGLGVVAIAFLPGSGLPGAGPYMYKRR